MFIYFIAAVFIYLVYVCVVRINAYNQRFGMSGENARAEAFMAIHLRTMTKN